MLILFEDREQFSKKGSCNSLKSLIISSSDILIFPPGLANVEHNKPNFGTADNLNHTHSFIASCYNSNGNLLLWNFQLLQNCSLIPNRKRQRYFLTFSQYDKILLVLFVIRCATWYHFYNLKNVKNTHERVLILVKLQATACSFTKINTPPLVFFTFFKF